MGREANSQRSTASRTPCVRHTEHRGPMSTTLLKDGPQEHQRNPLGWRSTVHPFKAHGLLEILKGTLPGRTVVENRRAQWSSEADR